MKKILLLVFLISSFAQGSIRDELTNFFAEEFVSQKDGKCKIKCRDLTLSEKYEAKVIDFDASTGITSCDVFAKVSTNNEKDKLSIMANLKDPDCEEQYKSIKVNYENKELASYKSINSDEYKKSVKIDDYERSITTLSKFTGGLVSLDPDIVNIKQSIDTGTIVKTNSLAFYNVSSASEKNPDRLYSVSDKLSRENMGYFIDLFYNMDKIYDYIVSYIFIFVALFFMGLYASNIGLKKLAKKNTTFDESWQSKIVIVVFATVIFFVPMKYDNNYSSTLFQNIWKYFIDESTSIADRANNIGMRTYLKSVYNTTGANGIESEANLVMLTKQQKHLSKVYLENLKLCTNRYSNSLTFQETNLNRINEIEEHAGKGEDNITYKGCRAIEKRYKVANTSFEQLTYMLERIKTSYSNTKLKERLDAINNYINIRVKEIGWYSAILAPTLKIIVSLSFLQDDSIQPSISKSEEAKINEVSQEKIEKIEKDIKGGQLFENLFSSNLGFQKIMGGVLAQLAYFTIPGANTIYAFSKDLSAKAATIIAKHLAIKGKTSGKVISTLLSNNFLSSFMLTVLIIKNILFFIPLVMAFIAAAVIILMYIYELIVFSFVSPFIVAFSLTTGQSKKIIDFLITAVTIFVKPTIIVISIYLSLFFYTVFSEVFLLLADEQFYLSLLSSESFVSEMFFYFIKEILFIFSIFGSIFIMWKIITQMSDFVFKIIGIDKLHNSTNFGSQASRSYGMYSFNA